MLLPELATRPFRRSPPSPGTAPRFEFPRVDRAHLPNGLLLQVCPLASPPVASALLFMRFGELDLPRERAGLAVLTGASLDGGTIRRNGGEMAEAMERLGARISVRVGWEGTSVSVSCASEKLPSALALLAETVREPAFPERETVRVRNQQLAGIRKREADPAGMASTEAARRYFASDTPYARPRTGFSASVGEATSAVARELAAKGYRPQGSTLVVAGNVTPASVRRMAHEHFGDWSGETRRGELPEPRAAIRERRAWVVNRPGSVQSEVRVGHLGVSARTPDLFPLTIGNLILGGMFSSRLNLALRERHGYTYGAKSRFWLRSQPGPFEVDTSVGTETTAPAVREILTELESFAEEGPSELEVATARDFAIGAFGLGLETAGQVAARLAFAAIHGLPDDHYPSYRERISEVTTGDVQEAMGRHLRPSECQVIVVGEADEVAPPLAEVVGGLSVVGKEPGSS